MCRFICLIYFYQILIAVEVFKILRMSDVRDEARSKMMLLDKASSSANNWKQTGFSFFFKQIKEFMILSNYSDINCHKQLSVKTS